MEENKPPSFLNQTPKPKRKHFLIIISGILLILIILLFAIGGGFDILKERVQLVIDTYRVSKATKQFEQGLEQYKQVLKEDAYGGKTPQETLDMFISALEKGDIELAAKYFALDENLSRKKWEDALWQANNEGRIEQILKELKFSKKDLREIIPNYSYEFVILNNEGMAEHTIYMKFNEYSGVWKIESM